MMIPAASLTFLEEEVEGSLCTRFEKVVRLVPERIAIRTKRQQLTYHALNCRANSVAHAIRSQQYSDQIPIALLFEQGVDAVVAILGVLKSGAFYVPLDPLYPVARNAHIFEDSQARLILTNQRNYEAALQLAEPGQSVLCLEDILATDAVTANPIVPIAPSALAYIIYTSGSTGEPKGVMHTHRNTLSDIWRQSQDLKTTVEDRYGMLFAPCSSVSVSHIFGALLNGATVLPFDIRESGFLALKSWLADEGITMLDLTTATFRQLCETFKQDEVAYPKLRLLAPGSEPVYRRDVELYKRYFAPSCVMQNAFGTTETRTAAQYFLTKDTLVTESLVPMGHAVKAKTVLLLDEERREVAPGEIGEIAVRSRYLSPGYWRKPEQTDAVFLPDPHGGEERTYLTGDLGQVNADGLLVHLGRKDFQVKIRGYRVEIPEVEMALSKLPGVAEAVAGAPEISEGHRQLVAYLVMERDKAPSIRDYRTQLAEWLPDYAIPTRFEFLRTLPKTLNGKLDRRALPVPRPTRITSLEEFVAPETAKEKLLASLFEEVLGIQPVGATDNFFELGGHSLLVARVAGRIEEEIKQPCPLSLLLAAPTARQLAERLAVETNGGHRRSPMPIQKSGRKTPLFCVPGGGGTSVEFQKLAWYLGDDQPVYGLDPQGVDGRDTPDTTIEAMAERYVNEMKTVQPRGPYLLLGFSMGGMVAFEMAHLLSASGEQAAFVGLIDTYFPESLPHPVRGSVSFAETSLRPCPGTVPWLHRKVNNAAHKAGKVVRTAQYEFLRGMGRAATWQVREKHLEDVHFRAAARYCPTRYPGRLTYFLAVSPSRTPDPLYLERGWGDLAQGGVDSFPIVGEHRLISEPSVRDLAQHLSKAIESAGV